MTDNELVYAVPASALLVGYWTVHQFLNWLESQKFKTDPGAESVGTAEAQEKQWFEVLNVSRYSSAEEVRSAYRIAIAMYHPDKVASLAPEFRSLANIRSQELNAAYKNAKKARGFK